MSFLQRRSYQQTRCLDRPQLKAAGDFVGVSFTDYAVIGDAMLEAENWKIALKRYEGHPIPALLLVHQMMAIRQCLENGKKGITAIAGLDLAIETLYPHTDFHNISHKLYLRRLAGMLKPEQEEKLRRLGVKI